MLKEWTSECVIAVLDELVLAVAVVVVVVVIIIICEHGGLRRLQAADVGLAGPSDGKTAFQQPAARSQTDPVILITEHADQ